MYRYCGVHADSLLRNCAEEDEGCESACRGSTLHAALASEHAVAGFGTFVYSSRARVVVRIS